MVDSFGRIGHSTLRVLQRLADVASGSSSHSTQANINHSTAIYHRLRQGLLHAAFEATAERFLRAPPIQAQLTQTAMSSQTLLSRHNLLAPASSQSGIPTASQDSEAGSSSPVVPTPSSSSHPSLSNPASQHIGHLLFSDALSSSSTPLPNV